ncbi:hypothetical protein [Planktotalea sp.]|uniref:hypothetical protein n=1 Tax=Planktotalea sp. TaxID=2029877 RepID=UPI003D6C6550
MTLFALIRNLSGAIVMALLLAPQPVAAQSFVMACGMPDCRHMGPYFINSPDAAVKARSKEIGTAMGKLRGAPAAQVLFTALKKNGCMVPVSPAGNKTYAKMGEYLWAAAGSSRKEFNAMARKSGWNNAGKKAFMTYAGKVLVDLGGPSLAKTKHAILNNRKRLAGITACS